MTREFLLVTHGLISGNNLLVYSQIQQTSHHLCHISRGASLASSLFCPPSPTTRSSIVISMVAWRRSHIMPPLTVQVLQALDIASAHFLQGLSSFFKHLPLSFPAQSYLWWLVLINRTLSGYKAVYNTNLYTTIAVYISLGHGYFPLDKLIAVYKLEKKIKRR